MPRLALVALPLCVAALAPHPARAERVHTDGCVVLRPDGGHEDVASCPVRHSSDNPYTALKRSDHKYIVLSKDRPIVLEVDGPGVGFRHLFLWRYAGGKVFADGTYTITIVRDGKEYVEQTFPIRPYPKHEVYGSAERMRTTMLRGTHRYEIRLSSEAEGDVIYYWKIGSIDGLYFHDGWQPWPKR